MNSKVREESINVSKIIPHGKSCLEIFVEKLRIWEYSFDSDNSGLLWYPFCQNAVLLGQEWGEWSTGNDSTGLRAWVSSLRKGVGGFHLYKR